MRLADDGRNTIMTSMYLNDKRMSRKDLSSIFGTEFINDVQKSFRESCFSCNAQKGFSLQYPTNKGVLTIKLCSWM